MLPAPFSQRLSLAAVLPSLLSAVRGEPNALDLRPTPRTLVLLVDGLGEHMLRARAGHARTLAGAPSRPITVGFPTTTAASLATLTTGTAPGQHGLVGYTALEPDARTVINQLNGWGEVLDPLTWQRQPTVFETAAGQGVATFAVGAARYEDSGFTKAVLRGAEYRIAPAIGDRLQMARESLVDAGEGVAYVYVPELDQVGHKLGWNSDQWLAALEELDSTLGEFTRSIPRGEGLLVTADHGMLDIPADRHVYVDTVPGLLDGVDAIAGEPRCLQLHVHPDASPEEFAAVLQRWRLSESHRSWVLTRHEAIEAGWFGPVVDPEVTRRIGDVIVAARKGIAYYDTRTATKSGLAMVGQHGAPTTEESRVPLAAFGSFA